MGKLDRKIALVAGGTTGIGLAAARLFQAEGARVTVTGCSPATVAQALALTHGRLDVLFIDDVDFKGVFVTLKRAASLLASGSSVILNATPNPALVSLTRVASAEWAARGIRIHAVNTGHTETMWYVPDSGGVIRSCTMLKRCGTPEEIARTSLILASESLSYPLGTKAAC